MLDLASVQGATEAVAVRRINEQVERYVAAQTRLCRDYNACILSLEEYKARSAELSDRLTTVGAAVAAINEAPSYRERQQALVPLYDALVPPGERPEDLTLEMRVDAELPASVGGGTLILAPGGRLPTNATVAFNFEVSRATYLYVFQRSPTGEPTVLFPNARIGTKNPLPAGTVQRIPQGNDRFRVNEKDLGEEQIYLVASVEPLPNLDVAMEKVAGGDVTRVDDIPELAALSGVPAAGCRPPTLARGLEFTPAASCRRGLEFVPAGAPTSLAARTDPGDSVLVKSFPFQHVTEAAFVAGVKPAASPTAPPSRKRGAAAEDDEPLQQ